MVAFIICIFLKLNEKRFFSWCYVGALHKCLENIILLLKDFASLFLVYVFVCGKNIYIGHDTKADDNVALTVTIIVISIRAIQTYLVCISCKYTYFYYWSRKTWYILSDTIH